MYLKMLYIFGWKQNFKNLNFIKFSNSWLPKSLGFPTRPRKKYSDQEIINIFENEVVFYIPILLHRSVQIYTFNFVRRDEKETNKLHPLDKFCSKERLFSLSFLASWHCPFWGCFRVLGEFRILRICSDWHSFLLFL